MPAPPPPLKCRTHLIDNCLRCRGLHPRLPQPELTRNEITRIAVTQVRAPWGLGSRLPDAIEFARAVIAADRALRNHHADQA